MKKTMGARQVAVEINDRATRADELEAYNTELYVRIPGVGVRAVKRVRLDEDCFVVLDLDWLASDAGRKVAT